MHIFRMTARIVQDDGTYLRTADHGEQIVQAPGWVSISIRTCAFPKWSTDGLRQRFCVASSESALDTGR